MQLVTKFAGHNTCATKIWKGLLCHAKESMDAINTSKQLLKYIIYTSILVWQGSTYDLFLIGKNKFDAIPKSSV